MPANYVLLERITLNATAASVTIDNIPQTGYTDLKVVVSSRGAQSGVAEANRIYFNGDTTNTNYTGKRLLGSGSAATSDQTPTISPGFFNNLASSTANIFSNSDVYIPNYTSSTVKSYSIDTVTENNAVEAYMAMVAVRWSGTAAINSITFVPESANNYVAGSEFSLYGIAATGTTPVIAPKASGGDIVVNDGTYWYHAFLGSGVFTPNEALTCQYLVIAGGGGGGSTLTGSYRSTGGGGAGGYRSSVTGESSGGGASAESPANLLTNTPYTVTVGAGGAGVVANGSNGSNGSNSSIIGGVISITSIGGGVGSSNLTGAGTAGGSGGGTYGGNATAGAGTANQGFAGGVGNVADIEYWGGGGGGGAGSVGGNGSSGTITSGGGNGGSGVSSSITGSAVSRAGGGGAGRGGGASAGGGAGAGGTGSGSSGTANTGGGGGGCGTFGGVVYTGGNGGSGIVVVRYLVA